MFPAMVRKSVSLGWSEALLGSRVLQTLTSLRGEPWLEKSAKKTEVDRLFQREVNHEAPLTQFETCRGDNRCRYNSRIAANKS
jgi:hypothetical protein